MVDVPAAQWLMSQLHNDRSAVSSLPIHPIHTHSAFTKKQSINAPLRISTRRPHCAQSPRPEGGVCACAAGGGVCASAGTGETCG